jgi:thioredoxin 1
MYELDTLLGDSSPDKLVVIDFYSTDCPPCKKIAPLYAEMSQLDEFSRVVFVKVNVDQHPDIAAKWNVTGWPAILFFKKGEVQTEIVGGKLIESTLYDWIRLFISKSKPQQ